MEYAVAARFQEFRQTVFNALIQARQGAPVLVGPPGSPPPPPLPEDYDTDAIAFGAVFGEPSEWLIERGLQWRSYQTISQFIKTNSKAWVGIVIDCSDTEAVEFALRWGEEYLVAQFVPNSRTKAASEP